MNENTFPRYMMAALDQRLRVMPAVVVTGARQTGKSTLELDHPTFDQYMNLKFFLEDKLGRPVDHYRKCPAHVISS